jgi:hypothetical protein
MDEKEGLDRWLMEGDPWVRFRILLDQHDRRSEADEARSALLAYPPFQALIARVKGPWPPLVSHKSAGHPVHALNFLAHSGLDAEALGLEGLLRGLLERFGEDHLPQVKMRIGKAYGGQDSEIMAWALCDAPILLDSLIGLGMGEERAVVQATDLLRAMVRENGWPCRVSPALGDFRGPGRKDDPCPYATLIMLRLLVRYPRIARGEEASMGVECLLDLWQRSREKHPYLFHMGTDFRKLKYPSLWYDVLSVLDVLTQYEAVRSDDRCMEMARLVRDKADAHGRYIPEAIWMDWRDWDFGQKKAPSRGLTFAVRRVLDRMEI